MNRWMTLAIAAPGLLLSAVLALFLALAAATAHPMWRWEPLNLSEAAALRDAGEVARLLDEGRDPNRAYVVRAGLLSEQPLELTPMQAAEAARRDEIVQLLRDYGVVGAR